LAVDGIFGLTDLQKAMLNFNKNRILKTALHTTHGFDDDLTLTDEYMQECIHDWVKELDVYHQDLRGEGPKDLTKYSMILLKDRNDSFAKNSLSARLIAGLPERANRFLKKRVRAFEASFLEKASQQVSIVETPSFHHTLHTIKSIKTFNENNGHENSSEGSPQPKE